MLEDLDRRFLQSQKVYYRAREQFELGEFTRALVLLRESWELHEHAPTAFWMGECHRYLKDTLSAGLWLEKAHRMKPSQATYAVGFGRFLMDVGRYGEAEAMASRAIASAPEFAPGHKLFELVRKRRTPRN
ncbi:MAG TPA: hypothetical protein VD997_14290 [Phycisphaerales bacterium]|nr:hypothetical protein [Phycisphaerales bacterium]